MKNSTFSGASSAALAAAAILALAGCSGGDDEVTGSTSGGSTTGSTTFTGSTTSGISTVAGSTAGVDCSYSGTYTGTYGSAGTKTATWSWTCSSSRRLLTGNGLPDHPVGAFPNAGNPNTISAQNINASMTLTPTRASSNTAVGGPGGAMVYARNSVKFDPGTAGTCPGTATSTSDCNLANGTGAWHIEALGQTAFNFGVDSNNAHVQPTGEYHYHGMPVALLAAAGASDTNRKMVLVGWAGDGYPVYARYCYSNANDASSALKVCTGSYVLDTTPDAGRPPVSLAPLGTFVSDWNYSAGSGDLDDCNGRTGVTPEFPNGIYYYMATDTYPYFSRCLKGNVN